MRHRSYRLGSRSKPKNNAEVIQILNQMIQDEADSFREIDGVVRHPGACLIIRTLRIARDYMRDFTPSEAAILNDLGDEE